MQEFRPKYNFFWQIFDIFCKVTAGAEKTLILHFFSKHFVTRDTRALALFAPFSRNSQVWPISRFREFEIPQLLVSKLCPRDSRLNSPQGPT